ncbi:hypothetical protein GOV07_00365 [Candidatus Woesearchaeota archaeon]|nr:hypothetical protein [Candidatus Woesearchaeota archaeon]
MKVIGTNYELIRNNLLQFPKPLSRPIGEHGEGERMIQRRVFDKEVEINRMKRGNYTPLKQVDIYNL